MALPYSLQFSTSFYVGTGISLFLLCRYEKIKEKEQYIEMFFLAGALTSYVDFDLSNICARYSTCIMYCIG